MFISSIRFACAIRICCGGSLIFTVQIDIVRIFLVLMFVLLIVPALLVLLSIDIL